MPGGLAEDVREWILGAASEAEGGKRDGGFRIRVGSVVEGSGMLLISGKLRDEEDVEGEGSSVMACLTGEGSGERAEVREEAEIEVRKPWWEVNLGDGGGVWLVGVEWRLVRD